MTLGENIYRYRTAKNWSQGDLAEALDVSRQSISKWENNLAAPDLDKLIRLHTVFEVSLDELILGEPATAPATDATENEPVETVAEEVSAPLPEPVPEPVPTPGPAPTIPPSIVSLTTRHLIGFAMLLFGLIFFLLAIFWGDSRYFTEEVAELISMLIILVSLFILAPYNKTVISICGIVYVIYCCICYCILDLTSISNGIFLTVASFVLLTWFIICGLHANHTN